MIQFAKWIVTWNITSASWISVFVPDATDSIIFLENLKIDIPQPLRYANTQVNSSVPRPNDTDF
jgi:hypothetical protein